MSDNALAEGTEVDIRGEEEIKDVSRVATGLERGIIGGGWAGSEPGDTKGPADEEAATRPGSGVAFVVGDKHGGALMEVIEAGTELGI